ncbi:Lactaldehyde dehydrogenase [Sodalis praecaptivus]
MADADLDLAVKAIVASRVINTGQVCNCAERVYVQDSIKDAFLNRLTEAFKQVTFGNPAEKDALDMGPLIDEVSLQGVQEKVDRAVSQGQPW